MTTHDPRHAYGPPDQWVAANPPMSPHPYPPAQLPPMSPQSPPPATKPRRRWVKPALITAAGLTIFGLGSMAGGGEYSSPAAMPAPTATVTTTAPAPTAPATAAPKSCLDALDDADRVNSLVGDAFGYVAAMMGHVEDAFESISNLDVDGVEAASRGIRKETKRLTNLREDKLEPRLASYQENRDACKSE